MRGYLNLFWVLVQVSRLPEAALGTLTAHIRANINGVYWIILTVLDGESADVRRYRIVHSLGSDFMKNQCVFVWVSLPKCSSPACIKTVIPVYLSRLQVPM